MYSGKIAVPPGGGGIGRSPPQEIVNFDLNCKSFYNRTANYLITTINYSIIPSNFIAPLLCSAHSRKDKHQVNIDFCCVLTLTSLLLFLNNNLGIT
jgi:hypothetical protein